MPKKRIIVCCDGTWQASVEPNSKDNVESNVTRMCRALWEVNAEDREKLQTEKNSPKTGNTPTSGTPAPSRSPSVQFEAGTLNGARPEAKRADSVQGGPPTPDTEEFPILKVEEAKGNHARTNSLPISQAPSDVGPPKRAYTEPAARRQSVPENEAEKKSPKGKKPPKKIEQVVYYQPGVGTNTVTTLSAVASGAEGLGLNEKVVEAYNFICLNYQGSLKMNGDVIVRDECGYAVVNENKSDEIFLFGFSRGAYIVRSLAGLIEKVGILKKSYLASFGQIYEQYQLGNPNPAGLPESAYKIPPRSAKIKVVGVWDTVGSLGVPDAWFVPHTVRKRFNQQYRFHDPKLSSCVENAFHALALDEHRRPFSPTLWYCPKQDNHQIENRFNRSPHAIPDKIKDLDESAEGFKRKGPNLIQCWFPGVHINVGGGSKDESDEARAAYTDIGEISYISFAWMVDLCKPFLNFHVGYLRSLNHKHLEVIRKLKQDMAHYELQRGGWAQGPILDSFEGAMAAAGTRTRAPGQYDIHMKHAKTQEDIVPETNEYIHPSVRIRMLKRFKHNPQKLFARITDQQSLAGFQMEYNEASTLNDSLTSGWRWVKTNSKMRVVIPEYNIPGLGDISGDAVVKKELYDDTYYAERAVLISPECQEELRMIKNPKSVLKVPKPVNVHHSFIWKVIYCIIKLILGFLPLSFNIVDNEYDRKHH